MWHFAQTRSVTEKTMTSYLALYTEFNIFCSALILLLMFHSFLGFGNTTTQHRFVSAMITMVVFFLSDTLWFMMDRGAVPQNHAISMILKSIYFLSAMRLLALPILFHLILCITNADTHILFYVDENFIYHRGALFLLQYVIIYIYIAAPCIHAFLLSFRKENYAYRDKFLLIAFFPVLPAIGGILQFFYWRVPINCMNLTFASFLIYLGGLKQQISLEPLTGLNNKRYFMQILEQAIQNKSVNENLYLLMIDMNRFKGINDNYGHIEGDYAICTVADIIRAAANETLKDSATDIKKKITVARYGGDEFVIAMIAEEEDALFLKAAIHNRLKEYNKTSGKSYELSTSIGIAKWKTEYESMKKFIETADAELYKEKNLTRKSL